MTTWTFLKQPTKRGKVELEDKIHAGGRFLAPKFRSYDNSYSKLYTRPEGSIK